MSHKIFLGSDHAGYQLKQDVIAFLTELGYEYEDLGTYDDQPSDYPHTAQNVALHVQQHNTFGILLCGSGTGEAIAANKIKGIRAANCNTEYLAKMSREHNDANVLCLGARIVSSDEAKHIIKVWLQTPFSGDERHVRRIHQIHDIEQQYFK